MSIFLKFNLIKTYLTLIWCSKPPSLQIIMFNIAGLINLNATQLADIRMIIAKFDRNPKDAALLPKHNDV